MKIPSNILHDKQYADKILEITADTMFFVYKDGTCLDFKANTTDFFIKEQDIIGRNIFSYFLWKRHGRCMRNSPKYGQETNFPHGITN